MKTMLSYLTRFEYFDELFDKLVVPDTSKDKVKNF